MMNRIKNDSQQALEAIAVTEVKKKIRVVVGVIWNPERTKVLISQRPQGKDFGGYWEFPGGKVELLEGDVAALERELAEELGILVEQCDHWFDITHEYPDKTITLVIYDVWSFTHEPQGVEGQKIQWQPIDALSSEVFPNANQALVNAVKTRCFE